MYDVTLQLIKKEGKEDIKNRGMIPLKSGSGVVLRYCSGWQADDHTKQWLSLNTNKSYKRTYGDNGM